MKYFTRDYSSVSHFAESLERRLNNSNRVSLLADHKKSSRYKTENAFYGYTSFSEALNIGLRGGHWPAGAAKIQPVTIDPDLVDPTHSAHAYSIGADINGVAPIVPAVLSGVPECMLTVEQTMQPRKLFTVGVATAVYAGATDDQIFNRGNAVLSILDALQYNGYSVSVDAVKCNISRGTQATATVQVKASDQHWDASSMAFALCHAAYNRRLGFAWLDTHKDTVKFSCDSYGQPQAPDRDKYDLIVPPLAGDRSSYLNACNTMQGAVDFTIKATLEALKHKKGK